MNFCSVVEMVYANSPSVCLHFHGMNPEKDLWTFPNTVSIILTEKAVQVE